MGRVIAQRVAVRWIAWLGLFGEIAKKICLLSAPPSVFDDKSRRCSK